MKRVVRYWIPMLILIGSSCSPEKTSETEKTETQKTPSLSVSGTLRLGSAERKVESCEIGESGIDQKLVLTLDDGAVLSIPIHESGLRYRSGKGAANEELGCTRSSKKGEGGKNYYKGTLEFDCTRGEEPLEMRLEITCGDEPPSNASPKK